MVHTEDRVDPVADLEIIHHELRQKDIERMEKIAEGLGKVGPPRDPAPTACTVSDDHVPRLP